MLPAHVRDITAQVAELRAQGQWDEERLVVSLRPVTPIPPTGAFSAEAQQLAEAGSVPVRIGRVSLFRG